MYDRYYQIKKEAAREIYTERPLIYSPFFKTDIRLGPDGFQHLCVSAQGERSREQQIERFTVLPFGIHILETATTCRSYQKRRLTVGTSGMFASKERKIVQGWCFEEHFKEQGMKVRVVVRKVGNGKLHFWSVMLHTRWSDQMTPIVFSRKRDEVRPRGVSRTFSPHVANPPTIRG